MSILPSAKTPLDQHSLRELEWWLTSLGAEQCIEDRCLWKWSTNQGPAQIIVKQNQLMVSWGNGDTQIQFIFPYGLPRQDIEAALNHGP